MSNRHPLKDDISYNTPHRSKPKRKHKERKNNSDTKNDIFQQPDFPGGRSDDLSVADYILSDNDNNDHEEYDSFYDENNNSKSGYKNSSADSNSDFNTHSSRKHRSTQRHTTGRSPFRKNDSEPYYDNFEIYDVDNDDTKN